MLVRISDDRPDNPTTPKLREVVLTVSGQVPTGLERDVSAGVRPRADYLEIAAACDADLVDQGDAKAAAGAVGRLLGRIAGADATVALHCFRQRRGRRVVITDGEGVGLLYAAVAGLAPRRARHIMIGHRLSPSKKVLMHRLLRLRRRIDHVVVYSSPQRDVAIETLGYRPEQVTMMPFMVDTRFWRPDGLRVDHRPRPMICAAGREWRDYGTLVEAVRGLELDVVLAAASPWSRRGDTTEGLDLPPNVTVTSLDHFGLRQLYAEASIVVVPVQETDFQAGITTILEAMSMSRPIVCTRTTGQGDTIVDGETGLYVPPADPAAMRSAILRLLDDPMTAARLAENGRRWVEQHASIERYAQRFAALAGGDRS